jgi:oxygen-independent coproporphyrinogen-3 oxidase
MCQGHVQFESVELSNLIEFKSYFAKEMEAMAGLAEQGLVSLDNTGIQVTDKGWFFVRAVAMVFDRHLQTDRTRARFSKII